MRPQNNRITKTTASIDILKQINTDCNLFDLIIYVLANSNSILIERPKDHKIWQTSAYNIGEYIRVKKVKTDWVRHIDGSYTKFDQDILHHIVPLRNEFGFYNIKHAINVSMKNYRLLRTFTNPNFKLTKTIRKNTKLNQFILSFDAAVPIWPLWALVTSNMKLKEPKFNLKRLFMKIDDVFYRFPYGNVNGNDKVCTGAGNKGDFKSVEDIWFNWITTTFNFDYKHNIKPNSLYMKKDKKGDDNRLIPVTYDLEYINMILHTSEDPVEKVSIIDALFYMSNIEDTRHIDFSKIFFKHPGIPEKVIES